MTSSAATTSTVTTTTPATAGAGAAAQPTAGDVTTAPSGAGGESVAAAQPAAGSAGAGGETTAPKEAATEAKGGEGAAEPGALGSLDEQGQQDDKGKPGQSEPAGELEIKIPEGATVSDAFMAEFKPFAAELKLSSEQASTVLERYLNVMEQARVANDAAFKTIQEGWRTKWQSDPVLGGSPEKIAATKQAIVVAMKAHGGEDAAAMAAEIAAAGLGDFTPWVRIIASVGRAMADDRSTDVQATGSSQPTRDEQLRGWFSQTPELFEGDGG